MMSETNGEVVRRIYAELERGDFRAVMSVLAEDVEFVTSCPTPRRR